MLTRITIAVLLLLSLQTKAQRDTSIHTFSRDSAIEYIGYGKVDALNRKQGPWVFHYYKINYVVRNRIYARYDIDASGYKQTFADSGIYENDKRSGLWIHWNKTGKVGGRLWYSTNDSIPKHIITYLPNGFKRHEVERMQTPRGEKHIIKIYRADEELLETQVVYNDPADGMHGIIYTHELLINDFRELFDFPQISNYAAINKKTIVNTSGQRIDSIFSKNGELTEIKNGYAVTTFFQNGKKSGYYTHDTILTWYENGQPATQSINLRNTGINARLIPGVVPSRGVFCRWSSTGELLREVYDYPDVLPAKTTALLGDERNQVRAQGLTDERGYRHGDWLFYKNDSAGNRWLCEQGRFEHGIKTGTWKGFHANGKLKYETTFVQYRAKYMPVTMYSKTTSRGDGDLLVIDKQKKNYIRIRAAEIVGTYKSYYANGKTQYELQLGANDRYEGSWKYHDSTGKLLAFRSYRKGLPADSAFWCYPNGDLFQKTFYDSLGQVVRSIRIAPAQIYQGIKEFKSSPDNSFVKGITPDPADPFEQLQQNCAGFGRLYPPPSNSKRYRKQVKHNLDTIAENKKKQKKYAHRLDWEQHHIFNWYFLLPW
jgi:antitoxin component YwqK of YwqJK toxin-antitoxin module